MRTFCDRAFADGGQEIVDDGVFVANFHVGNPDKGRARTGGKPIHIAVRRQYLAGARALPGQTRWRCVFVVAAAGVAVEEDAVCTAGRATSPARHCFRRPREPRLRRVAAAAVAHLERPFRPPVTPQRLRSASRFGPRRRINDFW